MLEEEKTARITTQDLIYSQCLELGKRMSGLERRMDKLEEKFEKQNEKIEALHSEQNAKIEKLADKIEALRNDLRGGLNHGQISNITTIGIALAVIYAILK